MEKQLAKQKEGYDKAVGKIGKERLYFRKFRGEDTII